MNRTLALLFVAYSYLGWFACVFLGKANDSPLSLLVPIPAILVAHFKVKLKTAEWLKALGLMALGLAFDDMANGMHWIHFRPELAAPMVPLWLISLWFLFLNYLPTLSKLFQANSVARSRVLLAVGFLLGAIFGPLSYWSGEKFQVLFFENSQAMLIYAGFWGFYFVLSILLFKTPSTARTP